MFLTHLVCSACGTKHDAARLQNLCTKCQKPLLAKYDLKTISRKLTRQKLNTRAERAWRFRELLPLAQNVEPISLGEGGTPLLRADRFGHQLGLSDLWIKDRSVNPTQSFRARGIRSPFRWRNILVRRSSQCQAPETPVARLPPTPLAPDWRRTFFHAL